MYENHKTLQVSVPISWAIQIFPTLLLPNRKNVVIVWAMLCCVPELTSIITEKQMEKKMSVMWECISMCVWWVKKCLVWTMAPSGWPIFAYPMFVKSWLTRFFQQSTSSHFFHPVQCVATCSNFSKTLNWFWGAGLQNGHTFCHSQLKNEKAMIKVFFKICEKPVDRKLIY